MWAAGNGDVAVLEVPQRNHGTLMTEMNAEDDQVGEAILRFMKDQS